MRVTADLCLLHVSLEIAVFHPSVDSCFQEEVVGVCYEVLLGICYNAFLLLDSVQSFWFLYFNIVTSWLFHRFLLIVASMNHWIAFTTATFQGLPSPCLGFLLGWLWSPLNQRQVVILAVMANFLKYCFQRLWFDFHTLMLCHICVIYMNSISCIFYTHCFMLESQNLPVKFFA